MKQAAIAGLFQARIAPCTITHFWFKLEYIQYFAIHRWLKFKQFWSSGKNGSYKISFQDK
ncbi:MAG: hypothetical protein BGO99_08985 [Nitrosospira sp. 56-18]|nr:MAG: hypothetical protein BGO99_08985 [Nitrosospira sp. 56-18]